MTRIRHVLIAIALAFTAYLAARGLYWTEPLYSPALMVGALGLYVATTWLCTLWQPPTSWRSGSGSTLVDTDRRRSVLPLWAALLALLSALLVPSAVAVAVGAEARTTPYGTWVIGGIGALMTIVMVRHRSWIAWVGTAAMAIACSMWMGPVDAAELGLVGSIVWVLVAQQLVRSMDRAARDTARLEELQSAASAWQASQSVRIRERRVRVQRALAIAGPVLTRTVASGGSLDEDEQFQARLAEGSLRDELRGARMLDDEVRAELVAARRRGSTVTMLDEGGLDGLDETSLAVIRSELAETLRTARSDRIFIRTSPHAEVAVTVVGRSGSGAGLSDEDAVDLWSEIAHASR